jgi:hypothetical protein
MLNNIGESYASSFLPPFSLRTLTMNGSGMYSVEGNNSVALPRTHMALLEKHTSLVRNPWKIFKTLARSSSFNRLIVQHSLLITCTLLLLLLRKESSHFLLLFKGHTLQYPSNGSFFIITSLPAIYEVMFFF